MTDVDRAIEELGLDLLRELKAIAWFCDSGPDGKYAMIPSSNRKHYEPGGDAGCVRLLGKTHCETIGRYRPALRMEQFGRQVLTRAKAMRLPLDDISDEEELEAC